MVLGEFKDGAVGSLWRQTSGRLMRRLMRALSDFGEASFRVLLVTTNGFRPSMVRYYVRRRISYVHDEVDLTKPAWRWHSHDHCEARP